MAGILAAYRPGRNGFFRELLLGKRVERILFAATKADHIHHTQHARLAALMAALVDEARRRADFAGAKTEAMAIAAIRATVEETREHRRRRALEWCAARWTAGEQAAFWPGDLPEDLTRLLVHRARRAPRTGPTGEFGVMAFRPAPAGPEAGRGAAAYPAGPGGASS